MPFDGATPKRTSEQQANLLDLIHDLRNLPEDWKWDYRGCATCALGRIQQLHNLQRAPLPDSVFVQQMLGLTEQQCVNAFSRIGVTDPYNSWRAACEREHVTPQRVAARLEGYL